MADGREPHIWWRRLNFSEARGRRETPRRPPPPPFRPDQRGHGSALRAQATAALEEAERERRALGIDPSRLLVLELGLLQNAERDHLDRLGIQIIDEAEGRQPVDPPYYALLLSFEDGGRLRAFAASTELAALGVSGTASVRGADSAPSESLLEAHFGGLEAATAFRANAELPGRFGFSPPTGRPQRVSSRPAYRVVAQFPDRPAAEAFLREAGSYAGRGPRASLTARQRDELFDALEGARALGPDDRRGARLRDEGVPQADTFYLDVDLWHPGSPSLVAAAIHEMRGLVARHGGAVTDGPTSVAETLLLARVRATPDTVGALLRYDRAALVDLPPQLPVSGFSIFTPITPPETLPVPGQDGPLACVVDSGVVAGHPLLSGLVVDERDFWSGDDTPSDRAGHGTFVSGIVAYGDVGECIRSGAWAPRVRLLSAKVLYTAPSGAAMFAEDERRVETQIREAITYYARQFGCRVFNLSLGHYSRSYREGRQLPWALLLDELAREHDVVLVVAAGNVIDPPIPSPASSERFQAEVREQLFSPEHALTDPACAVSVLTVGAIAGEAVPRDAPRRPEHRPPLVGSPTFGPSPFTRAGVVDSGRGGVGRAVKPDLVALGGNYCLGHGGRSWNQNDPALGVPSLRHDFQGERLVKAGTGTSFAAPFVTHVCALAEHQLRAARRTRPSANLIRALAVHSARVPAATAEWVAGDTTGEEAERRLLRLVGYGVPDAERALYSTDQRAVLLAEDAVEEGHYHVYELELPREFAEMGSRRRIRVTLAYDPPVRGTRRDYLGRRVYFRLVKGKTLAEIQAEAARGRDADQVKMSPSGERIRCSAVQSTTFTGTRPSSFGAPGPEGRPVWHVVVRCEARFAAVPETSQRYALVVSLEHDDAKVRIYQPIRVRVEQRVRLQWPGG